MNVNKKEKYQPVQVFVRIRPLSKQELQTNNTNIVDVKSHREITVKNNVSEKYQRNFVYDRVFGPTSKQVDIYAYVAEPMVAEVIAGYNCTVFAYGQTGTGKTYTMAGSCPTKFDAPWIEDVHSGIIPRTLEHFFDELRVRQLDSTVLVSYLELYNEEIFDLLSPIEDGIKLKLYDDNTKKGSVIVQGLTEVSVSNKNEVFKVLERGAEKRKTASTLMNAQSSRSHCVFCITVHTKESTDNGEDLLKTGKLYLVDLAGSENIKQSGATDKRAREACNINQSLLTLGRCITCLAERRSHVPYRESKLTRLLQDSLGGRTKTSLIATVSPAFCNLDETINTLEYASRARNITNKPEINQCLTRKAIIKEYAEQIERLRKDLQATRLCNGFYVAQENYDEMVQKLEVQRDEITDKINSIRAMKEQMIKIEEQCSLLKMDLDEARQEVRIKKETIGELETVLDGAKKEISTLQEHKEQQSFVIKKQTETARNLKDTARKLLKVANVSTSDNEKLHNKLDALSDLTRQNKSTHARHLTRCIDQLRTMHEALDGFRSRRLDLHERLRDSVRSMRNSEIDLERARNALQADLRSLEGDSMNRAQNDEIKIAEMSKLTENLCVDFSEATERAAQKLEDQFNERCQPFYKSMLEKLDDGKRSQKESGDRQREQFKRQLDLLSAFADRLRATVKTTEKIADALEEEGRALTVLHLANLKHALKQEEARIDMNDRLESVRMSLAQNVLVLTQTEDVADGWFLEEKRNTQRTLSGLRRATDATATIHRDVIGLANKANDEIDDCEDEFRDVCALADERLSAVEKKAEVALGEVYKNVDDIYESHRGTLKQANGCLESQRNSVEQQLKEEFLPGVGDYLRGSEDCWKNTADRLHSAVRRNDSFCQDHTGCVSDSLDRVERSADEDLRTACDEYELAHSKLDELQESVQQCNYRDYQKTNQTPVRGSYSYPQQLPEVQEPNEILGSKARENHIKIIDLVFETPEKNPLSEQNE